MGRPVDANQAGVLDAAARKAMRKAFTIDACIKAVVSLHRAFQAPSVRVDMERRIRNVYDSSIDLGAHPNIMRAQLAEPQDRYARSSVPPSRLRLQMTHDQPERLSTTLLTTVETGMTIALIVGLVLPESVHSVRAEIRLDEVKEQVRRLSELPSSGRPPRHPALKR